MKKQLLVLGVSALVLSAAVRVAGWAFGNEYAVTAEMALNRLKEGNARFAESRRFFMNVDKARQAEVAEKGQKPYATILGCSDSRVPLEHVFDAGIGDLFVVRVAGNVSGIDEIGTIEYGAGHLGTALVVVLGHTKCGAVTAVTKGDEVHGHIHALAEKIAPAVAKAKKKKGEAFSPELLNEAIEMNVWRAVEELFAQSEVVRGHVKDGTLKVVGAIYALESGRVEWLGEHPDQKALLTGGVNFHGVTGSMGGLLKKSSPWAAGTGVLLIVSYLAFALEFTRKKGMRIQVRIRALLFTLVAVTAVASVSGVMLARHAGEAVGWPAVALAALLPALLSLVFAFLFAGSIISSFRKVVSVLKSSGKIEGTE